MLESGEREGEREGLHVQEQILYFDTTKQYLEFNSRKMFLFLSKKRE
jgi:hypothetical protein